MEPMNITNANRKKALLLHYAGEEVSSSTGVGSSIIDRTSNMDGTDMKYLRILH
jgi:hypothetical protein